MKSYKSLMNFPYGDCGRVLIAHTEATLDIHVRYSLFTLFEMLWLSFFFAIFIERQRPYSEMERHVHHSDGLRRHRKQPGYQKTTSCSCECISPSLYSHCFYELWLNIKQRNMYALELCTNFLLITIDSSYKVPFPFHKGRQTMLSI